MKFKDPKTVEVFEGIGGALESAFHCNECCGWSTCEFGTEVMRDRSCNEFAARFPAEAARLMGYEVVDEESTVTINANKDEGLAAKRAAMRPDEYIVCTNATVIMDSSGRLSYFENGAPVCIIETEE